MPALFRRRKKPKSDATVLFVFIAVALSAVLMAVVLGTDLGLRRTAVDEVPNASVVSPSGALPTDVAEAIDFLTLQAVADPATVYLYRHYGWSESTLGLVAWDRRVGRYVLVSELPVAGWFPAPVSLGVAENGWGGTTLEMRGESGDSTVGTRVSYVRVVGTDLLPVTVQDKDGTCRDADFWTVEARGVTVNARVEDINGDGIAEAIEDETVDGHTTTSAVYVWNGEKLVFDASLTDALNLRDHIFPEMEPNAEPAE